MIDEVLPQSRAPLQGTLRDCLWKTQFGGKRREGESKQANIEVHLRTTAIGTARLPPPCLLLPRSPGTLSGLSFNTPQAELSHSFQN